MPPTCQGELRPVVRCNSTKLRVADALSHGRAFPLVFVENGSRPSRRIYQAVKEESHCRGLARAIRAKESEGRCRSIW